MKTVLRFKKELPANGRVPLFTVVVVDDPDQLDKKPASRYGRLVYTALQPRSDVTDRLELAGKLRARIEELFTDPTAPLCGFPTAKPEVPRVGKFTYAEIDALLDLGYNPIIESPRGTVIWGAGLADGTSLFYVRELVELLRRVSASFQFYQFEQTDEVLHAHLMEEAEKHLSDIRALWSSRSSSDIRIGNDLSDHNDRGVQIFSINPYHTRTMLGLSPIHIVANDYMFGSLLGESSDMELIHALYPHLFESEPTAHVDRYGRPIADE